MELAFIILTILLCLFALLAIYDGFYLHILKFELHRQKESQMEHLTHSLRALIFPAMVYFLFVLQDSSTGFYMGVFLILADLIILGLDAYMEKDSRLFMGGLPRWEYILHLFVNGFHFATIAVFLAVKIDLSETGLVLVHNFYGVKYFSLFQGVAINLIPGGVLMGLLHFLLIFPLSANLLNGLRDKLNCCKLKVDNQV